MFKQIKRSTPMLAIAIAGVIVGLATPAAAKQASHLINGSSIKKNSISGDRLKANTLTGKQIKESTLGQVPSAKTATTATTAKTADSLAAPVIHPLTLINGWQTWQVDPEDPSEPSFDRAAAYSIDAQGFVHLEGEIADGTSSTFAILPASAAPSVDLDIPIALAGTNIGHLDILTDGTMIAQDIGGAHSDSSANTYLDGVSFQR
jgi:hypothetical protein